MMLDLGAQKSLTRVYLIYMCMPGAKCDPQNKEGRTCHRMPALAVHYHLVTPYSLGMKKS